MRTESQHPPPSVEQRTPPQRTAAATNIATLLPTQAPGRLTRKARHFLPQIVQLRAQGYTLEAIQQALAAVGLSVSISTVRREAMRPLPIATSPVAAPGAPPSSIAIAPATPPPAALAPCAESPALPVTRGFSDASKGKDVAAAYAHGKSTNALTRAKERP